MSEMRVDNLEGAEHCEFCCDDGVVVVGSESRVFNGLRGDYEVVAPCPACARGERVEFPPNGRPSTWGKDGYWRGRPWNIKRACQCNAVPLARGDGSARAKSAARHLAPVQVEEHESLRTDVKFIVPPASTAPEPGTKDEEIL